MKKILNLGCLTIIIFLTLNLFGIQSEVHGANLNGDANTIESRLAEGSLRTNEVLVNFKDKDRFNFTNNRSFSEAESREFAIDNSIRFVRGSLSSSMATFSTDADLESTINKLSNLPEVESVLPNYYYYPAYALNDPFYTNGNLWGLNQPSDADIDLPEAYDTADVASANEVVVAVIDTGVKYDHQDLSSNMWDGSNCKDASGNNLGGCIHGYDFEDWDKDPMPGTSDDDDHGTHIAGTIAATHNNSTGIAGVYSKAKIMALRSALTTISLVDSVNFAKHNEAKVINASWGGFMPYEDPALANAIENFPGMFIAAAGNNGCDIENGPCVDSFGQPIPDSWSFFPCALNYENVICVAATDNNDNLASFSNYGSTSVDIAAPGTNILSTTIQSASSYGYKSGTSMATPHVSGAVAFALGNNTILTNKELRDIVLYSGDTHLHLIGKIIYGKRLNLNHSVRNTDLTQWYGNSETKSFIELANHDNKVYQTIRGLNDMILTRSSNDGLSWNSWERSDYSGGSLTLKEFGGDLYHTGRRPNGDIIMREKPFGLNWTNWSVNGGKTVTKITYSEYDGKLFQAVRRSDTTISTRYTSDGVNWSAWLDYGQTPGNITMTEFDGKLYQAVRGNSGMIFTRYTTDGINWSIWKGHGYTPGNVSMIEFDGVLYQAVRGNSGGIFTRYTSDGINWTEWNRNGATPGDVSMVVFDSKLVQSVRGNSNRIFTRYTTDGLNWTQWKSDGASQIDVSMIVYGDRIVQSVRGNTTPRVYSRISYDAETWTDWLYQ